MKFYLTKNKEKKSKKEMEEVIKNEQSSKKEKPILYSYTINQKESEEIDKINVEEMTIRKCLDTSYTIEMKNYYSKLYKEIWKKKQNYIYYLVQLYAPEEYKNLHDPIPMRYTEQLKKVSFCCIESYAALFANITNNNTNNNK